MTSYGRAEFVRDLGISDEAGARVATHLRLLTEWSAKMNLVGPKELEQYWRRHALDSGQLVRLAPGAKRWVDLGSGAGFPGLIIAALIADMPGAEIHLVEATAKKAAFLREAAREMAAPVQVFNQRIEDFGAGAGTYDVVTARALAPLPRLTLYANPILDRGAQGLFLKGAEIDAELAAAGLSQRGAQTGGAHRVDVLESLSDPRGRVVRLRRPR